MNRPLAFRSLPDQLKQAVYYRWYHQRHTHWKSLFEKSSLALCPNLFMHDLAVGDVISGSIAFTGFYELELSRRIAKHAAEGGMLVDVGANMGYFSLLWAGIGRGSVVAFEPSPRNLTILRNNVTMNGLNERIAVVPKAVGDRGGAITFDVGPDDQTGWGGMSTQTKSTDISVPMVRLDQAVPDADISVLKIDVEGADTLVLQGSEKLLQSKRVQNIYFEQNTTRMEQLGIRPGEAQEFLKRFGYSVSALGGDQAEWVAHL